MNEFLSAHWWYLLPGAILLVGLYRLIKFGGLRGMLFGRKVLARLADVRPAAKIQAGGGRRFKVYLVEGDLRGRRNVGLEVVSTGLLSWEATHVVLTKREVEALVNALESAARRAS